MWLKINNINMLAITSCCCFLQWTSFYTYCFCFLIRDNSETKLVIMIMPVRTVSQAPYREKERLGWNLKFRQCQAFTCAPWLLRTSALALATSGFRARSRGPQKCHLKRMKDNDILLLFKDNESTKRLFTLTFFYSHEINEAQTIIKGRTLLCSLLRKCELNY